MSSRNTRTWSRRCLSRLTKRSRLNSGDEDVDAARLQSRGSPSSRRSRSGRPCPSSCRRGSAARRRRSRGRSRASPRRAPRARHSRKRPASIGFTARSRPSKRKTRKWDLRKTSLERAAEEQREVAAHGEAQDHRLAHALGRDVRGRAAARAAATGCTGGPAARACSPLRRTDCRTGPRPPSIALSFRGARSRRATRNPPTPCIPRSSISPGDEESADALSLRGAADLTGRRGIRRRRR